MVASLAVVFPGQGSQRVGMGQELFEAEPALFHDYLDRADEIAGAPVSFSARKGPADDLTRTEIAQPALFALSMALWELALRDDVPATYLAGHSLGEYTAAGAAGALDYGEGLALVCMRSRLMADVQRRRPGGMAAVLGLDPELVSRLCREASGVGLAVVANRNSSRQVVVSGEIMAIDDVAERALAAGAEEVVRLPVGAAFHSPLMEEVRDGLADFMAGLEWRKPRLPVATATPPRVASRSDEIRSALLDQITGQVDWLGCVNLMRRLGCHTFFELGSGRVLAGLIHQIDPDLAAFSADGPSRVRTSLRLIREGPAAA